MNIDNFIGMTLFSNSVSGTAAISDMQSIAKGAAENAEGSLFQQLIIQMLSAKNQVTDLSAENLLDGIQSKTAGKEDLLSDLLLAGGNLTMSRLQSAGIELGEQAADDGVGNVLSMDEDGNAMESLQAMMAGLVSGVPVSNRDSVLPAVQTGQSIAAPQVLSIGQAAAAVIDPKGLNQQQYITANSMPGIVSEETAELNSGKPLIQAVEQIPTTEKTADRPAVASAEANENTGLNQNVPSKIELLKAAGAGPGPKTAAAENQVIAEAKEFKVTQNGNTGAITADFQTQDEAIVTEKKLIQDTAVEGIEPIRYVPQNPIHLAASGESTAADQMVKTAETAEPYSQIREEILAKLEQNGPKEFKMQLDPEDLGQIDIKLKLSEGKLIIDIMAASARTQALLTGQVDKLISSIGLQNVQVESVQVSQQVNNQSQDSSLGYSMNSAMDFSQRRQQEQYQQGVFNTGKLTGTFSLQQDDQQADSTMNRIGTSRYEFNRMNYTV